MNVSMFGLKQGLPSRSLLAVSAMILASACGQSPQGGGQSYANQGSGQGAPFAATQASAPMAGGMTFTDPTENAFQVSVPQGWQARGGVVRHSATDARIWVSATSPDGSSTVFMGDPTIPIFELPTPQHPEGTQVQGVAGPQPVVSYESGAQFAAMYGQRMLASACGQVQPSGGQPEPAVAQKQQAESDAMRARIGPNLPPVTTQIDAGSAVFTCQINGRPYVAGFIAATAVSHIGPGGLWTVPVIIGYRAPAEHQADADRFARGLQFSLQRNPDWLGKMADATRQALAQQRAQGAANMQILQQQAAADSAMLNQQYQNNVNAQNQRYNDFNNQQNAQRDARNAAFAQHEDQRDVNQQREMRYIQNRVCIEWYDASHQHCRVTADQ